MLRWSFIQWLAFHRQLAIKGQIVLMGSDYGWLLFAVSCTESPNHLFCGCQFYSQVCQFILSKNGVVTVTGAGFFT